MQGSVIAHSSTSAVILRKLALMADWKMLTLTLRLFKSLTVCDAINLFGPTLDHL